MAGKKGLGKGLSALLPDEIITPEKLLEEALQSEKDYASEKEAVPGSGGAENLKTLSGGTKKGGGEIFVSPDKLKPNPSQPRKNFNEAELQELADSIRQQGIIQPIIAEDAGDGTFIIIAGERRTRAARLAGLEEVPVILRNYSDEKRMEVSLIENIQRSDLNPVEEAAAYRQLMDAEKLSQDEVAARVGKNRATIANALRLLKLPEEMQESLKKAELSPGHARAILSVPNSRAQETLFREILKRGLSVREAEKRAAALGSQNKKPEKTAAKGRAPELTAMEEKFITRLGTKTVINGDLNRGSVVIDYYSMEDLERLYEILGG